MKRCLLLVSTLAVTLLSAQNNDALKRKIQARKQDNFAKFDAYVAKQYGTQRSEQVQKEIAQKRKNLAGFFLDRPYFYEKHDTDQNSNSNVDFVQNGTVAGLNGSFNGENIKFTVFDGGRAFEDHILFNNGNNRVTNMEIDTLNHSDHATAVTGFIGAKNQPFNFTLQNGTPYPVNFKGVAPNSTFDNYAFANTILPGQTTESDVFDKILLAQPKISNHSYGANPGWSDSAIPGAWVFMGNYSVAGTAYDLQGTYMDSDQIYDEIVYTNPSYIIVKSAGNSYGMGPTGNNYPKYYINANGGASPFGANNPIPPNNCALGYDCIGYGSLGKNIIVVAANDIITSNSKRYTNPTDVVHSSYSSAGPRDDGGIKPDITATGTNVAHASTDEDTTGSDLVSVGSGTSYSAPVVTGIIGLWTQINKQLFNNAELNAASAKTLMVHSALEAGNIGPDPVYGWGLIDAKKGAEILVGKSNNTVIFNDETLNNGGNNQKTVVASGNEPLKVSISWIDPEYIPPYITYQQAHNNRTSKLINDLDLRVIDTETGISYTPWKLDANNPLTPATKGDNTVDNVEQVVIDTPVAGRAYRIEVTHKGTLMNNALTPVTAPQNYSIIATGYSQQVLGTGETVKDSGIIVAPTVTKNIVKVLKAPAKSNFSVYDLSGKKLQSGKVNGDTSIDLSTYIKGIYIIEVKTENEVVAKKVIKE